MNALQINPNWKSFYHYPTKAKLGAINAMMPTGKIIGFLFVAPFSNRFGRKPSLILAFAISVIGAAIQAASMNLGLLIFSRFFLGFGCGVMSQPSPILLAELAYPPHRGKVTALYHCFYVSDNFPVVFFFWKAYWGCALTVCRYCSSLSELSQLLGSLSAHSE